MEEEPVNDEVTETPEPAADESTAEAEHEQNEQMLQFKINGKTVDKPFNEVQKMMAASLSFDDLNKQKKEFESNIENMRQKISQEAISNYTKQNEGAIKEQIKKDAQALAEKFIEQKERHANMTDAEIEKEHVKNEMEMMNRKLEQMEYSLKQKDQERDQLIQERQEISDNALIETILKQNNMNDVMIGGLMFNALNDARKDNKTVDHNELFQDAKNQRFNDINEFLSNLNDETLKTFLNEKNATRLKRLFKVTPDKPVVDGDREHSGF